MLSEIIQAQKNGITGILPNVQLRRRKKERGWKLGMCKGERWKREKAEKGQWRNEEFIVCTSVETLLYLI